MSAKVGNHGRERMRDYILVKKKKKERKGELTPTKGHRSSICPRRENAPWKRRKKKIIQLDSPNRYISKGGGCLGRRRLNARQRGRRP